MKKATLTKYAFALMIATGSSIYGANAVAPAPSADCSKELLMAYFPKPFVEETLGRFKVPKDQWEAINRELAIKDKEIVKIVEAKAAKMNPNPLTDPQQRQAAVKLFRETLFDNFSTVMKAHGIRDDKQIQSMLDDIQQQKAKRFARCMAPQLRGGQPGNQNLDDNDED